MRGRALNQLLHGTLSVSKKIKATTKSTTTGTKQPKATGAELPMYFVNAVIDEATGEVNIPAIVDCDTGMINAVIDPVTGEQKFIRHLISDNTTQKLEPCNERRGKPIGRDRNNTLYSMF